MATLVLTVIGDDRAGLVSALADVVADHDGSWGRSQLSELAGKFAGIVTVEIPGGRVDEFQAALGPLSGILETHVYQAAPEAQAGDVQHSHHDAGHTVRLDLIGNDRPGIVKEITGALAEHGVSIEQLETWTSPAPMAGGELFELAATVRPATGADLDQARRALESLASELMVDITFGPPGSPT